MCVVRGRGKFVNVLEQKNPMVVLDSYGCWILGGFPLTLFHVESLNPRALYMCLVTTSQLNHVVLLHQYHSVNVYALCLITT